MSSNLKIESLDPPTSLQAIRLFEAEYKIELPSNYKSFLIKNNGGIPNASIFKIINHPSQEDDELQLFMGLNTQINSSNLSFELSLFHDSIPVGIVPFACTGGLNLVCLDIRNGSNKVVYWDMLEFWGKNVWNESMLFDISNTFEEFLGSLVVPG